MIQQKIESERLKRLYPNLLPVILARSSDSDPEIDKRKYLVPHELNVHDLLHIVRKRLTLRPSEALFLFCNNTVLCGSQVIRDVHRNHNKEGFLNVTYSLENTFGNASPPPLQNK